MRPTDTPTTTVEGCVHSNTHRHGTASAYDKHQCRCDDCRAARSAYARDYYATRQPVVDPLGGFIKAGSAEWLTLMRVGLYDAYNKSITENGLQ